MTLRKDEYMIKGDSVVIPKRVLEEWRDHYHQNVIEQKTEYLEWYYHGKSDVFTDLLKMFEQLEG